MTSSTIAELEAAWADLLQLFGDLVVARHRGSPPDPSFGSTPGLARRYRAARRRFGPLLAAVATPLSADDHRAVDTMAGCLPWLDELEPTPGLGDADPGPGSADRDIDALRRSVYRRYGRAATTIRVDGETIDRLTALARLGTEPDPATRRRIFEAMAPVWRSVDGDGGPRSPYRRLLRSSAGAWDSDGSPIEANAAALGLDPNALEPMLRAILAAWRAVIGADLVEPWDYRYLVGAASRRLDRRAPVERLQAINDDYLASLGADPRALGIGYDVLPRPGRPIIPVAFTIGRGPERHPGPGETGDRWRARSPWVFATYREGGLGNLAELLHESGHAIHMAAVRARPAFAEFPVASAAFLEATADVLGSVAFDPAWQRRWLGEAADPREAILEAYGGTMLDVCWALFEMALHRDPDRRPNDVWSELTSSGLGIVSHPDWSWWAVRGQLIESPGYLANYAMSAIVAAAIRGRLRDLRGDWSSGDPGWYGAVSEALFSAGSERSPAELLTAFLGGPVTAEPLLAELSRAR